MTIYVDELPKRCLECGFCCKDDLGYWCQGREKNEVFIADEMCIKQRLMSCPLQSLSNYTKQVRKEVVQEIREKMTYWEDCLTKEVTEYVIDKETLDQIEQGETSD